MSPTAFSVSPRGLSIREARSDDAAPACDLVRQSIVDLCHLDHHDERGLLAVWLANKTPENIRAWIVQSHVFVAERDGMMVGVAAVTGTGEITLNYVLPSQRFSGISRALLLGLEERARDLRLATCTLEPTKTALTFYLAAGYRWSEGSRRAASLVKTL